MVWTRFSDLNPASLVNTVMATGTQGARSGDDEYEEEDTPMKVQGIGELMLDIGKTGAGVHVLFCFVFDKFTFKQLL